jgi:aromatic-L-amino-acid decarboxylase
VLRWYGAEGLRAHIRKHVSLAQEFAGWVAADDRFELLAPHPLSLVTFRLTAGDQATRAAIDEINNSGAAYLTHTTIEGHVAVRVAIGAVLTEREHVQALWQVFRMLAAPVQAQRARLGRAD